MTDNPERERQIIPTHLGIGRPLTEESLEVFDAMFREIMPSYVRFRFRGITGMNYVNANDLTAAYSPELAQPDYPAVDFWVGKLVTAYCDETVLHESAMSEASFSIEGLRFKHAGSGKVQMRIRDKESQEYGGYQFDGEKGAIRRALGLPRLNANRGADVAPRPTVKFGQVESSQDLRALIPLLAEVRQSLRGKLALGRVGLISSTPR